MNDVLPIVDRPRDAANLRAYVSPSRLNCWLRCPLAFRLRYIDGFEPPCSPAQALGRAVHRALEMWYRHRQVQIHVHAEDVLDRIPQIWESILGEEQVAFESSEEENQCCEQVHGLVATYLRQADPDEARPASVEAAYEAMLIDPTTGENLGIPLLGVVDLVLDEPAGPLVVDFKTAARSGAPHEVTHEIQLTSYAYLHRHAHGNHESALEIRQLIKTKQPKIEYHRFGRRNEQHFRRLFAVIRQYLDALDNNRFAYRPSLACASCEFREGACLSWDGD